MTYTSSVFGSDRLAETRKLLGGVQVNAMIAGQNQRRHSCRNRRALCRVGARPCAGKTLADSEPFPSDQVDILDLDPVGPDCDPAGSGSLNVKEI